MAFRTIPDLTESDIQRFRAKIAPPVQNGCELWTASTRKGYGQFGVSRNKKQMMFPSSRLAYFLHYGKQPGDLMVCHNCPGGDNPLCTAKAHLFLGTAGENTRDAKAKGMLPTGDRRGERTHPEAILRGEQNPQAKLTAQQVRQIRSLKGKESSYAVGPKFGVNRVTICAIWNGINWAHLL